MTHFFDRLQLNPKQRRLLWQATGGGHKHPVLLYGGAGGGGKSYGLRALCVYALLMLTGLGVHNQRVILACSTYRLLADRHIGKFLQEYAWLGAELRSNDEHGLHIRFSKNLKMGVVCLRNLDDPDKYRGTECVGIAVDEATEIPEDVKGIPVIATLLYPLRQPESIPFTFLVFGSNPDGIGYIWVKNLFITRSTVMVPDPPIAPERVDYIEARYVDNPIGATQAWLDNLKTFPERIRLARLNADWSSPEGARFAMLSADTHLYDFQDRFPRGVPSSYKRILSVDYGLRAPYCALWHAIDEMGDVWTYREDYKTGLYDKAQAERIRDLTTKSETSIVLRADPAMWAKKPGDDGEEEPAYIDAYVDVLGKDPRFTTIEKGYNRSRDHALGSLHRLLTYGNDAPDWHIERSCVNLWRELTGAIYDPKKPNSEGIHDDNADHAITSAYYGLHWHLRGGGPTSGTFVFDREAAMAAIEDAMFEERLGAFR